MEKIIGINPTIEALKSNKNIENLEIFSGIKKEAIKGSALRQLDLSAAAISTAFCSL